MLLKSFIFKTAILNICHKSKNNVSHQNKNVFYKYNHYITDS
jgi:hypothetical protein